MKMGKLMKMNAVTQMVVAMVLGSLVGIVVGKPAMAIGFIGDIWLNLMKMFLVPIVLCMLVKGITTMDSPKTLGRLGIRFMLFYMTTTVFASILGVGITRFFNLGTGFSFKTANTAAKIKELPSIDKFFTDMFSKNIFQSFAKGDMMQVLIIACFIGVAIVLLPPEKREPVKAWFVSMTDLMMSLINIALRLAPIGVFCLMAATLGKYGVGMLATIAQILGTFYGVCIIHVILVYCLLLTAFSGIMPWTFLKKAFPTFITAASTCSSNAVVPVSLEVCKKNFKVSDMVAGLGIPLGATVNKDGVAILCGVVLVFSANAMGMPLTNGQLLNLIFATTLVTSAGSGVPGGGLMNMMIVATAIGMPLDIVMMVGGFYRFFDMGTTSLNCMGDVSATVLIDRVERRMNGEPAPKI